MRIVKNLLCCASVLLVSGSIFAKFNNKCPPLNVIKNAKFTKASNYRGDWWILTTDNYIYNGNTWNTSFQFPGYFDDEQFALRQGTVTFKSIMMNINEPKKTGDDSLSCIYTDSYDYYVTANCPPSK